MIGKRAQRALKHLAVVRPIRGQCAVDAFSKSPQPFVCFAQPKLTSFAEKFQSTRQFVRASSHVLPSFESDHVNVPKRNNNVLYHFDQLDSHVSRTPVFCLKSVPVTGHRG